MDFKIILLAIALVGIAFIGIAIKMFLIKGGEFKKSCSTVDPKTGERMGCTCGSTDAEPCHNKDPKE